MSLVENVGGAGGMTGAARVAKAAPDGYSVRARQRRHARGEPDALQASALQRGERFRAGRAVRRAAAGAGHAQGFAGRQSPGVHRLRQGEPGKMQFGSARRRLGDASRPARCSTPRSASTSPTFPIAAAARRCRIWSPAGSTISASIRRDRDSADRERPDQGAGDPRPATRSASLPNCRRRRSRASPISRRRTGSVLHAQGHAGADRGRSCGRQRHGESVPTRCRKRMKEIGVDPVAPERRSPEYLAKFVDSRDRQMGRPGEGERARTDSVGQEGERLALTFPSSLARRAAFEDRRPARDLGLHVGVECRRRCARPCRGSSRRAC